MTIGNGVKKIGRYAFAGCAGLTEVTIPKSVTVIDHWAFEDCEKLTQVNYCGTESEWNEIIVGAHNEKLEEATLHLVEWIPGDVDANGVVNTDDAVYLLLHVMFGAKDYPVVDGMNLNFDDSGIVDTGDAVYLLLHVMFGSVDYPI